MAALGRLLGIDTDCDHVLHPKGDLIDTAFQILPVAGAVAGVVLGAMAPFDQRGRMIAMASLAPSGYFLGDVLATGNQSSAQKLGITLAAGAAPLGLDLVGVTSGLYQGVAAGASAVVVGPFLGPVFKDVGLVSDAARPLTAVFGIGTRTASCVVGSIVKGVTEVNRPCTRGTVDAGCECYAAQYPNADIRSWGGVCRVHNCDTWQQNQPGNYKTALTHHGTPTFSLCEYKAKAEKAISENPDACICLEGSHYHSVWPAWNPKTNSLGCIVDETHPAGETNDFLKYLDTSKGLGNRQPDYGDKFYDPCTKTEAAIWRQNLPTMVRFDRDNGVEKDTLKQYAFSLDGKSDPKAQSHYDRYMSRYSEQAQPFVNTVLQSVMPGFGPYTDTQRKSLSSVTSAEQSAVERLKESGDTKQFVKTLQGIQKSLEKHEALPVAHQSHAKTAQQMKAATTQQVASTEKLMQQVKSGEITTKEYVAKLGQATKSYQAALPKTKAQLMAEARAEQAVVQKKLAAGTIEGQEFGREMIAISKKYTPLLQKAA